jgi:hypothetical protein
VTTMTMFDSDSGLFSLRLPSDWVVTEHVDGNGVLMASSETALLRLNAGTALLPGELAMNIGFIPVAWFASPEFAGLGIQLGSSPARFLASMKSMIRLSRGYTEGTVVGDPEPVLVDTDVEAGLLTVSGETCGGLLIAFEPTEGVLSFVTMIGYPGELSSHREVACAVASSISWAGSAEDLAVAFSWT